jgi:transcriptional regulator with XRE-family HTH domain
METTGQRVRRYRRRAGLTQTELGRRMEPVRSQPWVSGVEGDEIVLDSMATLTTLARALNVHPADLTGQPFRVGATPAEDRGHAAISEIRRQIERHDLPAEWDRPVRTVPELAAAVSSCSDLRQAARYGALAEVIAPLLAELQAATELYTGDEVAEVWRLLAIAYREADSVAYGLGYLDLSILATERVRWAAAQSGDVLQVGVGEYLRVRQQWESASWSDALLVLDRAIGRLESDGAAATPAGTSVIGSIQLRAAITAARKYDADEAWSRYDEAKACLTRLGPAAPDFCRLVFTTGNVAIHGVAVAVELGDGVEAVRRGAGLRVDPALPHSRAGHHYLDMARGWLWYGDRERALSSLEKADKVAPTLIRHHPMAQATARALLDAEQRGYRERVRSLGSKLHVL